MQKRFEIPQAGDCSKWRLRWRLSARGSREMALALASLTIVAAGRAPGVQGARSLYTAVRLAKGCSVELYERE